MKTEAYTCQYCGAQCTRPLARGQKPKWCSASCADRGKRQTRAEARICAHCNATYVGSGKTFCSKSCAAVVGNRKRRRSVPKQPTLPFDQRSDIRRAYEDGDHKLLLDAVRRYCRVDDTGCWVWQRQARKGYPVFRHSKGEFQVHRAMIEATHGAPLGTQVVHHTCANTLCVNPDHLQPVTHRDNIAEMLARKSYLSRIAELEAALRDVAPSHPALNVIAVA